MLKPRQSMLVTQEDRSSSQLASSQTDYEPTTLSSQVDSQRDKDKSPLSELCGCQDHYSECLSRTKLESWDEVHRRFFADQGNLFSNVLKEMQCKGTSASYKKPVNVERFRNCFGHALENW